MTIIKVTNQAEMDAACKQQQADPNTRIHVVGSSRVEARDSSHVVARDSSRVVAWDSSRVVAWDSSRVVAWESSRVEAWDSSRVEARESSHVVAWESSRVVARESSHVVARESSHVEAWDSSRVEARESSRVVARDSSRVVARGSSHVEARGSSHVKAHSHVAIHQHSKRAKITGGVVIDCTKPILSTGDALRQWGQLDTHTATLFKAVDDDLRSGKGFHYPIGETVEAPDWDATTKCGGGLHLSPTPAAARGYFPQATRFLRCEVDVADLALCDVVPFPDKVKARRVRVVGEVDLWGDPVGGAVS